MFSSSIKAFTLLLVTILVFSNLTEAASKLCRTCLNGGITFGIESDQYGEALIETTGDCDKVTFVKTPADIVFVDFGDKSHEFAVFPTDQSWVLVCDLGTATTGCCDLP